MNLNSSEISNFKIVDYAYENLSILIAIAKLELGKGKIF